MPHELIDPGSVEPRASAPQDEDDELEMADDEDEEDFDEDGELEDDEEVED